jgi:hypothetical protein
MPALFAVQPAITSFGDLSYTPAANAYGQAVVSVVLSDDGGILNDGIDTSPSQTFTITVNAPPTANIASPTNGAFFMVSENITVVADASDPDGHVVQVELFQGTDLISIRTNAPYYTVRTNLPVGQYQFSARATDNLGSTGTSIPVGVTVLDRPPLLRLGPIHLNRQTGLFEETVRVTNPTRVPYKGVRILVKDLASTVQVYNASGTTNGIPYLQSNLTIAPGGSVDMTIEYYVRDSRLPTSTLVAELVSSSPTASPTGVPVGITRQVSLADGTFLLEFNSLLNRVYYVQYSSDLREWKTVIPAINGTGTRTQWLDNGAPKTLSLPSTDSHRFYRMIVLP